MRIDNEYPPQREGVQALHNRWGGDPLFVFGTGPSLLEMDLELLASLQKKFTFSTNRLQDWKDIPFRPDFHGLSESEDMPHLKEYRRWASTKYFACHPEPIDESNWTWIPKTIDGSHENNLAVYGMQGLGDTLGPLPTASSTPLTLGVQVGAWMGFDPIYLLGCDNTARGQVFGESISRPNPHPQVTTSAAQRMKTDMQEAGRKLVDCTPNGKLGIGYTALEEVLGAHAGVV